jgi:hypothetical protein
LLELNDGITGAIVLCMRLATFLLSAIALLGQDNSAQKFIGTWEARFNGAVFCVLKIPAGDKLAGTMSSIDISIDEEGNLRSAEAGDGEFAILQPRIENGSLLFEWTDNPDEPPLKLELKITGKQEAELRFVAPPDGATIKPFQFKKRD